MITVTTRYLKGALRILDIGDKITHKLPSCQEKPGRIYSRIIALPPERSFLLHSQMLPFYRESCRVGTYIKIQTTGSYGTIKKDSNLKDAPGCQARRPCVHSICRRLRDPSLSVSLSFSLVTRIHRPYDRRALTSSVTSALWEKILYKKIEPRYTYTHTHTFYFSLSLTLCKRMTHKEKVL